MQDWEREFQVRCESLGLSFTNPDNEMEKLGLTDDFTEPFHDTVNANNEAAMSAFEDYITDLVDENDIESFKTNITENDHFDSFDDITEISEVIVNASKNNITFLKELSHSEIFKDTIPEDLLSKLKTSSNAMSF
jgi:hypothetical protein